MCSVPENDLRNSWGVVRTNSGEAFKLSVCVRAVGEKLSVKLTACPPGAQNTPVEKKGWCWWWMWDGGVRGCHDDPSHFQFWKASMWICVKFNSRRWLGAASGLFLGAELSDLLPVTQPFYLDSQNHGTPHCGHDQQTAWWYNTYHTCVICSTSSV